MDRREISNSFFSLVAAGGIAAVIGAVTAPALATYQHLLMVAGLVAIGVGLLGLLCLYLTKPKKEPLLAGDTFNVNNSGSGFAAGQVGTVNIGKVPYRLSDQHKAQVLASIDRSKPVSVGWVGFDGGRELSMELRSYLEQNGVATAEGESHGMLMPPLASPIEIKGNTIIVDPSR
jgi:hypothetical protein